MADRGGAPPPEDGEQEKEQEGFLAKFNSGTMPTHKTNQKKMEAITASMAKVDDQIAPSMTVGAFKTAFEQVPIKQEEPQ